MSAISDSDQSRITASSRPAAKSSHTMHLALAQRHHNLLRAGFSTSGHPGLLWFELILSISPAQKQPVRSVSDEL